MMDDKKEQRGVQSIEVGGRLLQAMADYGEPITLGCLARKADMPASRAHPYLVSLGKVGMVVQDPATSRYELGPLAMQMGLASLRRQTPLRTVLDEVGALVEATRQTIAVAVWGTHGPTVVSILESSHPVHVNLRPGAVMSIVNTATGNIFAAFLPQDLVVRAIAREESFAVEATGATGPGMHEDFEAALETIRASRIARAMGKPLPGINAFSVPVFDHNGRLALAVTAIGPAGMLDPDWNSPVANAMHAFSSRMSARLGFKEGAFS